MMNPCMSRFHCCKSTIPALLAGLLLFAGRWLRDSPPKAIAVRPLKVLLVTSGGFHDYKTLAPFLTNHLAQLVERNFRCEARAWMFSDDPEIRRSL